MPDQRDVSNMNGIDRRSFIQTSAVAGAGLMTWRPTLGSGRAMQKLSVASVGVGGMGSNDLKEVASHPDTVIVALCDVDENRLAQAATKHPNAVTFTDYREMFAAMGDKIDAVTVSTPDHMHAPVTMTALNHDKHVYCQKPLTHSIHEARAIREAVAGKPGLATQMGTQNASRPMKRRAMKALENGICGRIIEIRALTDRPGVEGNPWWPQGEPRPTGSDPVPSNLKWDEWIGVAEMRPYKNNTYHPFKWRGFHDFGVGALGDMGCHIVDAPFQVYGLGDPTMVKCEPVKTSDDMFPRREVVKMMLPGVKASEGEPIPFTWYDGGLKPQASEFKSLGLPDDYKVDYNVVMVVGEKGTLVVPIPGDGTKFYRKGMLRNIELPQHEGKNHWHHWVEAARGGDPNWTPFDYATRVTETLAIGAVASRFPGEELQWDAKGMKFTNKPEANEYVTRKYREGWEVEGL